MPLTVGPVPTHSKMITVVSLREPPASLKPSVWAITPTEQAVTHSSKPTMAASTSLTRPLLPRLSLDSHRNASTIPLHQPCTHVQFNTTQTVRAGTAISVSIREDSPFTAARLCSMWTPSSRVSDSMPGRRAHTSSLEGSRLASPRRQV